MSSTTAFIPHKNACDENKNKGTQHNEHDIVGLGRKPRVSELVRTFTTYILNYLQHMKQVLTSFFDKYSQFSTILDNVTVSRTFDAFAQIQPLSPTQISYGNSLPISFSRGKSLDFNL
uniref:Uncharacterized protein n=1 Tax=Romanomermis culicivorax TaxID=13658 RepID=A0A915KEU1_ROMCU